MLAYGETHKDKNALAATRTAESRRENTSTNTGPQTVLVHEWLCLVDTDRRQADR